MNMEYFIYVAKPIITLITLVSFALLSFSLFCPGTSTRAKK